MNLLFICSRNNWRSPTAEEVYKNVQGIQVKSAGTEPAARVRVSAKHLVWSDMVFVMEKKHKQRLQENFPNEIQGKKLIVLDIPDEYTFMDEELIESLKIAISPYLSLD